MMRRTSQIPPAMPRAMPTTWLQFMNTCTCGVTRLHVRQEQAPAGQGIAAAGNQLICLNPVYILPVPSCSVKCAKCAGTQVKRSLSTDRAPAACSRRTDPARRHAGSVQATINSPAASLARRWVAYGERWPTPANCTQRQAGRHAPAVAVEPAVWPTMHTQQRQARSNVRHTAAKGGQASIVHASSGRQEASATGWRHQHPGRQQRPQWQAGSRAAAAAASTRAATAG